MSNAAEDAKKYLQERDIPTLFESLMTGLMYNRPEDHIQFMLACLLKLKQEPSTKVTWDLFVDQPPNLTALTGTALMNGVATAADPSSGSSSGSGKRRSSSSSRTKGGRPSSKDRGGKSREKRPSKQEIFEQRLSTPLARERELQIPQIPIILLFGGPGGAKTEQGARIATYFEQDGMIQVSMPEMVKEAFKKYHTAYPEWKEAKAQYDRGELLPNNVMMALLKQEIANNPTARYIIMDGYPRTATQVRELEQNRANVKLAIILDFDEDSLNEQVRKRGYGSAIVNKRLQEFKEKTLPVAKYYDDKYMLHLVPGEQDEDSIFEDIKRLVEKMMKGELEQPAHIGALNQESGNIAVQNGEAATNLPASGITAPDVPILLVVGAPGSLKSEYCRRVAKRYDGFVHLSMGALIRKELEDADRNNDARGMFNNGKLVPNDLCNQLIWDAINASPGIWGFVIEGYPRDLNQAAEFEMKVNRIDLVLLIDCTENFCMGNLDARLAEDGGKERPEENQGIFKERLANFKDRTLPMLKYFDEKSKLKVVEGDKGVDEVMPDVFNILDTALFIPQDSGSGKSLGT